MTTRNGFVLSSEPVPWSWRQRDIVHVQKSNVEAAARLALYQDFDVKQLNAFCLCIEGERRVRQAPGDGSFAFRRSSGSVESAGEPYELFCDLILEVSTELIRPDVCKGGGGGGGDAAQIPRVGSGSSRSDSSVLGVRRRSARAEGEGDACPLPVEKRFRYFLSSVSRARVWQDDEHALFRRLQERPRFGVFRRRFG